MNNQEYEQKKEECWKEAVLHGALEIDKDLLFDHAFKCGYALGKKIGNSDFSDAEEAVISGWVARDENNSLYLYEKRPVRDHDEWVEETVIYLDDDLFPDLTWDSAPEPIEIIIKRKKNG